MAIVLCTLKNYVTFEVAMLPSQGLKKHGCCSSFRPLQRVEPHDLILICLPSPQEAEHCAHGDQASQVPIKKLQLLYLLQHLFYYTPM